MQLITTWQVDSSNVIKIIDNLCGRAVTCQNINSFWCHNLDDHLVERLEPLGLVIRVNTPEFNLATLSKNFLLKHINLLLPIFKYVHVNSAHLFTLPPNFDSYDIIILDRATNNFIIKKSEITILLFRLLEKHFLRQHGLLNEDNFNYTDHFDLLKNYNKYTELLHNDELGSTPELTTGHMFAYTEVLKYKTNIKIYEA